MAVKIGASVEMTDRKAGEKDEQAIWAWGRLPACPIKCIASGRPTHASVVGPCPCQVFFDNKERHHYTLRSLETVRDPCLASPVAAAPAYDPLLAPDSPSGYFTPRAGASEMVEASDVAMGYLGSPEPPVNEFARALILMSLGSSGRRCGREASASPPVDLAATRTPFPREQLPRLGGRLLNRPACRHYAPRSCPPPRAVSDTSIRSMEGQKGFER